MKNRAGIGRALLAIIIVIVVILVGVGVYVATVTSSTTTSLSSTSMSYSSISYSSSSTSSTSTVTSTSSPTTSSITNLYQEAKAEGSVVLYDCEDNAPVQNAISVFEANYPGIQVQYTRASAAQILSKALTELQVGSTHFDAIFCPLSIMTVLKSAGAFSAFLSPSSGNYSATLRIDKDNVLQPVNDENVIGLLYDKNVITVGQLPNNLTDLLNPEWSGKIVMPDPALHPTMTTWTYWINQTMGSEGQTFLKGLAKQNVLLVANFLEALNDISSGQRPIGITFTKYLSPAYNITDLGNIELKPYLVEGNSIALAAKAAHPAAAELFINFLLSASGENALASKGEYVSYPGVYPPIQGVQDWTTVVMQPLSNQTSQAWAQTAHQWITTGS